MACVVRQPEHRAEATKQLNLSTGKRIVARSIRRETSATWVKRLHNASHFFDDLG
jgi:hypothetical protein